MRGNEKNKEVYWIELISIQLESDRFTSPIGLVGVARRLLFACCSLDSKVMMKARKERSRRLRVSNPAEKE